MSVVLHFYAGFKQGWIEGEEDLFTARNRTEFKPTVTASMRDLIDECV